MKATYHIQLLHEAGIIEAQNVSTLGPDGYNWKPKRLTFQGHEFLDCIRDDGIWGKTKEAATSVGSACLELMWQLAKGYARQNKQEKHPNLIKLRCADIARYTNFNWHSLP